MADQDQLAPTLQSPAQTQDSSDKDIEGSIDPTLSAQFGAPTFLENKSVAPYQRFLETNPQFAHIDKQVVLGDMHKTIAPELDYNRFEALAQQPMGWQAIQDAKKNLTEVEKFRAANPQFYHTSREDIISAMYDNAVESGKVNKRLTSLEEYTHEIDPLPGTMNDLWNAWEGIKTTASETTHSSEAGLFGGYYKWLTDEYNEFLNIASSRVDIAKDGKVTFNKGTLGTQSAQDFKTLQQGLDDWVAANQPGFFDIVKKIREVVAGTGLTSESQEQFAKVDETRSQHAKGAYGELGKVVGAAGTDLALNWPLGGALQKGFEATKAGGALLSAAEKNQLLINKSAAFIAATYQSASKYHEAMEAHHENALAEGLLSGFSAPMAGYLFNSGAGRVQTGLMQSILDAGADQLEDIINGRPTDYYRRVSQTALDFGLGALIGGNVHQPLLAESGHIPLEFADKVHRPLTREDVLGGEEEDYPTKIAARSPLRLIQRKERRASVNIPSPEAQPPPESEDVLGKGRPLVREVPIQGDRGIRLLSNRLRLNIPDIDETLRSTEGIEETVSAPNVITYGKETVGKRVIGVRPNLEQQRVQEGWPGYSSEVWEQVMKAVDAREQGDVPAASEALDTATALMTEPERDKFHSDLVNSVKGVTKVTEPGQALPDRLDDPRLDDNQAFFKFDQEMGYKTYHQVHPNPGEKGGTKGVKYTKDIDPFTGHETLIVDPNPEAEPRPGETAERAETAEKTVPGPRRKVKRGELGAVINPAQVMLEAGRKIGELYDEHWKYWLPGTMRSHEFSRAAALLREADVRTQTDEVFKERMTTNTAFNRYSGISQNRRRWWNKFSNDTLKQILIDQSNNVRTQLVGKNAQYNDNLFLMGRRYYQMRRSRTQAHLDFDFEPQGDPVRDMVHDSYKGKYDNWLTRWKAQNPGREKPQLEEVFDRDTGAKVMFKSYNPEDWLQAELDQTRRPLNQLEALNLLKDGGMAIPKLNRYYTPGDPRHSVQYRQALEQSLLNRKHPWVVIKAPNNDVFYVEPEAAKAYKIFFDTNSIYNVPVIGTVFGGVRNLKSYGSNILTWSLFHPMHIGRIYIAHAFSAALDGAPLSEIFNPKAAGVEFRNWIPRFTDDPVIDYFHERIPRESMSQNDLWWVDKFKRAGLNIGINQERQMQLEFGRNLAEYARNLAPILRGADRAVTLGIKWLQGDWIQRMAFGEWIPRIKSQAFRQSVIALLNEHPELEADYNRVEFSRALAKIGDDIEDRFGERNMNNILWPRIYKEIGMSSLLSLGWQLGFLRVNGGAIKDMTTNAIHARDIFRSASDPLKRKALTNRINFLMAYTTGFLVYNALNSLFYGYSKGKKFEPKDLVYPVIGEDKHFLPTDPHRWTRGRTGEFQSELLTGMADINNYGLLYGGEHFALGKINPGVRSFWEAWIAQEDYFGKGIGYGDITEPEWRRIADKMGYMLFNDTIPITFKQQIQARVGRPAPHSFDEYLKSVASPDAIPGILGVPRAPEYVYRSKMENEIVNAYTMKNTKLKTDETIERGHWINEYRNAIEQNDQQREQQALQVLTDKYKIKKGPLKQITREAERGTTSFMYMFRHGGFSRAEQQKLLEYATPEERKEYEPYVQPE